MMMNSLRCRIGLHNYTHQTPNVIKKTEYGFLYAGVTLICGRCGNTKDHYDQVFGLPIVMPEPITTPGKRCRLSPAASARCLAAYPWHRYA